MKSPTCVSQPLVVSVNTSDDNGNNSVKNLASKFGSVRRTSTTPASSNKSRNSLKSWVASSNRNNITSPLANKPSLPLTQQQSSKSPTKKVTPAKARAATTRTSTNITPKKAITRAVTSKPTVAPTTAAIRAPKHPGTQESVNDQIQNIKKRIQWLEKQKASDKELYNLRLTKAQKECKDKLLQIYKPKQGGEGGETFEEQRVAENTKMISYLREENRNIRTQMDYLSKSIKELKSQNASLEKANEDVAKARKELDGYVDGLQKSHDKLTDTVSKCRTRLEIMKAEYNKRHDHYLSEVYGRSAYENGLNKILPEINTRCNRPGSKDRHTNLVNTIMKLAKDAEQDAKRGVDMVLDEFDLNALPELHNAPRRSIMDWKNSSGRSSNTSLTSGLDSDSDEDE